MEILKDGSQLLSQQNVFSKKISDLKMKESATTPLKLHGHESAEFHLKHEKELQQLVQGVKHLMKADLTALNLCQIRHN